MAASARAGLLRPARARGAAAVPRWPWRAAPALTKSRAAAPVHRHWRVLKVVGSAARPLRPSALGAGWWCGGLRRSRGAGLGLVRAARRGLRPEVRQWGSWCPKGCLSAWGRCRCTVWGRSGWMVPLSLGGAWSRGIACPALYRRLALCRPNRHGLVIYRIWVMAAGECMRGPGACGPGAVPLLAMVLTAGRAGAAELRRYCVL